MPPIASHRTLLVTALLVTWIVWGSSFVAIEFALESMPPLLLMASRFAVAGLVALGVGTLLSRRAGAAPASLRQWRDAAIVGTGFVAVGMGATSWAATRLPSSVNALLVATAPLWIVLLQLVASRGASRCAWALGGVAVGLVGVLVLVAPGSGSGSGLDPLACAVLVAANGVWAAATLFARRADRPDGLLRGIGMQMTSGGVLLGVLGIATGEAGSFDPSAIGAVAAGSWSYLVVAASLGGFLAYGWLLEHASASTASTHAFVNPLVAVALGAAMLGEAVEARTIVAAAAIVMAVVLLLVGEARRRPATPVQEPVRAPIRRPRRAAASSRPIALHPRSGRPRGWSPAPTPAFAARRPSRSYSPTDGMDPLAIDDALDRFG